MFQICKVFLSYFACILITSCNLVSSDDIPALLWNIKGNALRIKPVSALGHNDETFAEILKDIHQESNIVVFAVNKLSLEDFSNEKSVTLNNTLNNIESFLDLQPHMILPSVKDPLNYIHKAPCGVQEIVVDNKIDESILNSLSSLLQVSCVVIFHISDDGVVAKEGELKPVFLPFEKSNKNIMGIFTGVKSSWGIPNNDRHIFRNLLQAPTVDDNFFNFTGCIIMYAKNASIKVGNEESDIVSLPFPPSLEGSTCDNETSRVLQLNFKTSGILSSVTIRFDFTKSRGSWKTGGTVTVTNNTYQEEINLDSEFIQAPLGFSFSCGDLILRANRSDVTIKFNRFQIQPYQVKEVFSDSFDCVTFFTIPIWMGIIVSILFIAITNIGVYALFSVRTMDRFDDPKGKTISVAATAD